MKIDRTNIKPIKMTYTNYRGETSVRSVTPISIEFGRTDWHKKPQWLMSAYDNDKKAHRQFALSDCDFTTSDTIEGE